MGLYIQLYIYIYIHEMLPVRDVFNSHAPSGLMLPSCSRWGRLRSACGGRDSSPWRHRRKSCGSFGAGHQVNYLVWFINILSGTRTSSINRSGIYQPFWHLPTISFVIGSGALAPIAPRDIQVFVKCVRLL